MLAQKNINKKRLAVYIVTMIAMFSGMAYFIYKNYKLYSKGISAGQGSDLFIEDFADGEGGAGMEAAPDMGKPAETPRKQELKLLDNPQYRILEESEIDFSIENNIGEKDPFNKNTDNANKEQ